MPKAKPVLRALVRSKTAPSRYQRTTKNESKIGRKTRRSTFSKMVEFFEDRFFQTVESETNDAERLDPKKRITLYIDTNIIITIYNSYNNDINNIIIIIIIIMIIIIIIKKKKTTGSVRGGRPSPNIVCSRIAYIDVGAIGCNGPGFKGYFFPLLRTTQRKVPDNLGHCKARFTVSFQMFMFVFAA